MLNNKKAIINLHADNKLIYPDNIAELYCLIDYGLFGNSFKFDGSSKIIIRGSVIANVRIKSFCLYVKFTNNNATNTLCIVKRITGTTDANFSFFWTSPNASNGEKILIDFGGVRYSYTVNLRSIDISKWYFVYVQVIDNDILVIIDNNVITHITSTNLYKSSNADLYIGVNNPNNTDFSECCIDSLCFFSNKLTNSDINRVKLSLHPIQ